MGGVSGPIRVLHVDDQPDFAALTAELLEREDERFQVETASSAAEGLTRLTDGTVDCVISDYDMPGQDGIEFLEAVREEYPDLPFVLYTATGNEAVASEAISAGVTDYVQKGSEARQRDVLAHRIENAVERHRQETRLERLVDTLPGMVYRCRNEPGWPMTSVRGEVESLTGYPADALESRAGFYGDEVIHPDDREAVWASVQSALDARESFEVTYRIRSGDGVEKWVWERGRGVYADGGEVAAIEGFVTDITDRWETTQDLRETNTVLRAILEHLPAGVLVEDADRNILVVNDRLTELLDGPESRADVVGNDCAAMARQMAGQFEDPEQFVTRIEAVVAAREPVRGEELALADGRTFERDYVPYTLPDGEASLWIYRDVTDRRERERELVRQNERLDEFARVASHDLRNPLNVAQGHLELAQEGGEGDHLDEAANALDRSLTLVEDLLTLARQGEGTGDLEPVPLDEAISDCWRTIDCSDAALDVRTDATVRADPSRLKQLFENLLQNAVEHGSTDGRATSGDGADHAGTGVTVRVGEAEDGFYVADDGPGVPEDEREQVFEAGYSTGDRGTGFGLSIVRQIADAHGWAVAVGESEAGGARFDVTGVEFV
jgi:PAS domain S-box-containing protein